MYKIEPHHQQKANELGVKIYPSKKGNYKLDVYDKKGQYITSVGHKNYKDFVMYWKEKGLDYANERKRLYNIRHKNDTGLRGFYAKNLLWN
jgi:hypothetical protein